MLDGDVGLGCACSDGSVRPHRPCANHSRSQQLSAGGSFSSAAANRDGCRRFTSTRGDSVGS